MSGDSSVSDWIQGLKANDERAAQEIWNRYFLQLVEIARRKLPQGARRSLDEEDIAASAFESFFDGAQNGRFPQLDDRDNLWRLLIRISSYKVIDHIERECRQKRGGGKVAGESAFQSPKAVSATGIDGIVGSEPSPELAVQIAEDLHALTDKLADEKARSVAIMKLQGYTNCEIGRELGVSERTVERKLWLIRSAWSDSNSAIS